MAVIQCICGERIEVGADEASVFATMRAHNDAAHTNPPIPDAWIHELIAARRRMPDWDGVVRPVVSPPVVEQLTGNRLDDFLEFFDHVAFADNPSWASCYCVFPHYAGNDWGATGADENRAARIELVRRGERHGHMAYVDGKPAGWCNAGPRRLYPWVTNEPEFASDDAGDVGSILCFVVAPSYRRQGIGRALLDGACAEFRERGLKVAEGYPAAATISAARAYHGPIEMYLEAGFERVREAGEGRHVIVRKAL